jgi:two-component system, NarL family, sensor histidine kinase UhpB
MMRKTIAKKWPIIEAMKGDATQARPARRATEERDTQKALRESEERFRKLVFALPDAITTVGLDGRITYVSPKVLQMYGHQSEEEILGRSPLDWIEASYREKARTNIANAFVGIYSTDNEYLLLKKDGTTFWGEINAATLTDTDKRPTGIIAVTRDVTLRREAEQHRKQSEEKYRRLVERSPAILYEYSDKKGGTFYSSRAEALLGYPVEYLLQNPRLWHDSIHPADIAEVDHAIAHAGQGHDFELEYRIRDVNGEWHWVYDRSIGKLVKEDELLIEGIALDITQRKEAERQLAVSETRYRRIVDGSPDAILVQSNGKFTYVNPAGTKLFGARHQEELLGRSILDVVHPESRDEVTIRMRETGEGKTVPLMEQKLVKLDGTIIEAEVVGIPDVQEGRNVVMVLVRDITKRKQAERELRRRLQDLTVLHQAGISLSEPVDVQEVGKRILQSVEQLLHWQRGSTWIIDERAGGLRLLAHSDMGLGGHALQCELDRVNSLVSGLGVGITGWVAKYGKPVRLGNVKADPRYVEADPAIRSELCVPLKVGGRTVGALNVESTSQNAFDENDELLLMTLASQAAIAVENALLLSDFRAELTERRRVEDQLRQSEDRFRRLAENAPDMIFRMSLPDGQFVYVSPASTILTGYEPREWIDAPSLMRKIIHPDWRQYLEEQWARLLAGDLLPTHEYQIFHKSGEIRWLNQRNVMIRDEYGLPVAIEGIITDVTDRKRAMAELSRLNEQQRALSARLLHAREEERTKIAREVHDELGQSLTGLKMDLSWALGRIPPQEEHLLNKTKSMIGVVDDTIRTVRRIATEMRPGILDDLGLVAALEWQAQEFQERSGIQCAVTGNFGDLAIDEGPTTALFRIFQESLINVVRHAQAARVDVSLTREVGCVRLDIIDDGIGIREEEQQSGQSLGILGMRERAMAYGGAFSISGTKGRGTTVTVKIPILSLARV